MGETIAETRLEVDAQRSEIERTAERLKGKVRHTLDVKARFRENPLLFVGIGAGTAFLVVGGPIRVARMLRRRLRPSTGEQAYAALPKSMQNWVEAMVDGVGPKADQARAALVHEIQRWRHEPLRSKKARKELAKAAIEGPPGPSRAGWKAAEAALTLLSAAVARRAVEAFITRERSNGTRPKSPPETPNEAAEEYSGMSSRGRS